MSRLTLWFEKRAKQSKNDFSVDQLSQVLELSTEEKRSKQEEKMLQGIIQFGNTEVKEVMCPRVDMFTLSEKTSFLEIIPLIVDKGFSRIPIYKDKQEKYQESYTSKICCLIWAINISNGKTYCVNLIMFPSIKN